jgi:hypothetical protein
MEKHLKNQLNTMLCTSELEDTQRRIHKRTILSE